MFLSFAFMVISSSPLIRILFGTQVEQNFQGLTLKDEDADVRESAAEALTKIKGKPVAID